jgi:hypothetical protein
VRNCELTTTVLFRLALVALAVLVLAGILVFRQDDSTEVIRLEQQRDAAIRARDSVEWAHRKTREDYEALILHYRHSKAGQERAERVAAESQLALRAAQKARPKVYSDVQIDSTLQVWYPE